MDSVCTSTHYNISAHEAMGFLSASRINGANINVIIERHVAHYLPVRDNIF